MVFMGLDRRKPFMKNMASISQPGRRRLGKEVWKDVPGFGGHYMASTHGRVKSKSRTVFKRNQHGGISEQHYKEKILTSKPYGKNGYCRLHLSVDGNKITVPTHHMILLAFDGPRPDGMEGCHSDNDPSNNRPDNLRWDTHHENNQDRKRAGHYATGEHHPMAKITKSVAEAIALADAHTDEICRRYGVSKNTVLRIKSGASWPCLTVERIPAKGKKRKRYAKGEGVHGAKLSTSDVVAIRNSNLPQEKLAALYGVTQSTISCIKLLKTWRHVDG